MGCLIRYKHTDRHKREILIQRIETFVGFFAACFFIVPGLGLCIFMFGDLFLSEKKSPLVIILFAFVTAWVWLLVLLLGFWLVLAIISVIALICFYWFLY